MITVYSTTSSPALASPGEAIVFSPFRSGVEEVSDLLAKNFPGLKWKLETFPYTSVPNGQPAHFAFAHLGSVELLFRDEGVMPLVQVTATFGNRQFSPVETRIPPQGGSAWIAFGGDDGKPYVACIDFTAASEKRYTADRK